MKNIIIMLFIMFVPQKSYSTNLLPSLPAKPAATGTILVTAIVPITCTVTTAAIAFPNYLTSSASNTTQNAPLIVTCTNGTAYNIELSAGNGVSATTSSRSMTSVTGNHSLPYKLCQDAACTKNWGMQDGTDTVSYTSRGGVDNYVVYGVIAPGGNPVGGVYSDIINVTVNY